MEIWPAIDLRGGKCVRLRQGDYHQETVFGDDPAAMARRWAGEGAECLHLVDLDGAKQGRLVNLAAIQSIVDAVDVPCELGGGIRDEGAVAELLGIGLARLVVGTKALQEPSWLKAMCEKFPHQLVLGIDARDGRVATDGWLKSSDVAAVDLARSHADLPLAAIIYTDIARDGMMSGPNFEATAQMKAASTAPVIASGGVSTIEDVRRLAEIGADGCVIGRALYEGAFDLQQALAVAKQQSF